MSSWQRPGRLNDLCGQGYIDLEDIELFVLDEADRMLDMGFVDDVERIIHRMGEHDDMQTLLFSATMPKSVQSLVKRLLKDDFTRVEVNPVSTTVEKIDQSVYFVDRENKKSCCCTRCVIRSCTARWYLCAPSRAAIEWRMI